MNRRRVIGLPMIAALGLMLSASHGTAQSAKDLVGTWAIVTAKNYGSMPKGALMFDANGHFSMMFMRADLPKFASNNRTQGTAAEYKGTVNGSLAFYGTYAVNGTEIVFHIESSTFANWNGTDQKRINLSVVGDELKYIHPTPSNGSGPDSLVWKRAK
jgi:hypothetical protein